MQRNAKEVLAEVLEKLTGELDAPAVSTSAKGNRRGNTVGPNRDRLTVGLDLGDRWSAGVSIAFLVWMEKRWPKDSCERRRKM